jgi:hypothetical protein
MTGIGFADNKTLRFNDSVDLANLTIIHDIVGHDVWQKAPDPFGPGASHLLSQAFGL